MRHRRSHNSVWERAQPALRQSARPLSAVGKLFPETLDIDFVQPDPGFIGLEPLFDPRIVFLAAQARALLLGELLSCQLELALFLREFLFQDLAAGRIALPLGVGTDAGEAGGVLLRLEIG